MYRKRLVMVGVVAAIVLALGAGAAQGAVSSFTVDPTAILSAGGTQVTVIGTITCTSGDTVNFFASAYQTVGRIQRGATGTTTVICTGAEQSWSVLASANTPLRLLAGPANVYAQAFDSTDFTFTSHQGVIRLSP